MDIKWRRIGKISTITFLFILILQVPAYARLLKVEHVKSGNLGMEVKVSLKKNKIKAATVTAIAINGKASMNYDDCRVLVPLPRRMIAYPVPDGSHLPPEEILLSNLRSMDLSAATFDKDELPDAPHMIPYRYYVDGKLEDPSSSRGNLRRYFPGVFEWFESLEHILLPDSLKRIGSRAFASCIRLKNFSFPRELKSIGREAFLNCKAFKSPRMVLEVAHVTGGKLHEEIRHSLKRDRIVAEMVTDIVITGEAPMTYEDCRVLVSAYDYDIFVGGEIIGILPNLRAVDLRNGAFENGIMPDRPPDVWGEPHELQLKPWEVSGFPSRRRVGPIPYGVFEGFSKLEKIFLPASLKKIGYMAFSRCINLKTIIPDTEAYKGPEGFSIMSASDGY
jgi:hypothetical protein